MEEKEFSIPINLEVHPLGDNGEIDIVPASGKNILSSSQLPCGLPPILPDISSMLNSFLDDLEKLPIFHLDAVQKFIPIEPNISSLYTVDLCPLQTTLTVKRNVMTGKLLGFSEEVKDIFEGTYKTSSSLSRAPGPPDAGVKGNSSGLPFWPGGMDEPVTGILKADNLNVSLFEGDLLDTPPGFEHGMKFERKVYDQVDCMYPQPQEIYLSDILAMDDSVDFDMIQEESEKSSNDAIKQEDQTQEKEIVEGEESILKLASEPILKISDYTPKKASAHYDWAVIENASEPVDDAFARITKLSHTWKFTLDNFQKRAILHLEKKENVFVAAHTSAGKTVVAEYAISLAKKNFSKVVYTSPIKALSNQKFRDFQDTFGDVGLITGDVQENPTAFCLIMTTEILRSMLYHGSDLIRELEWVIFDEVHYINDPERGVVWEEVFIMLPDHVNLIMLSATVPNTAEFAEWLGSIKKRKIYVISTLTRPVPLVFELFIGSAKKSDERFVIINEKGQFLDNMYNRALKAKKDGEKSKAPTGAKGPRYTVIPGQEKNIYIKLLSCLEKNDLKPAVIFMFSRKRCNNMIDLLKSENLVTQKESGKIVSFFDKSIQDLPGTDRDLAQVKIMRECLSRGFGVHHSGILPILKEIVEILVKNKLVKVLFATETFAMGVNMPTKTVVFDSFQKHDGLNFRDLQPSEFIQMAGRAGRRNEDKIGTVILLCKGDVPDCFSLKYMMQGEPTKLQSQFKLTYSMILNLLKIKTLRVEDVMKRSFGESKSERNKKGIQVSLAEARNKLDSKAKPECSLCDIDLVAFMSTLSEISSLRESVMPHICAEAISRKIFTPGRIIVVSTEKENNVPGVLLSIDKEKCKVLVIAAQAEPSEKTGPEIKPWSKRVYFPHSKKPDIITVLLKDIIVITSKTIKIQEQDIMRESRQMGAMKAKHSIMSAFQDLCSITETNINGFSAANVNIKDMDMINDICRLKDLENEFENYMCLKCPNISNHFSAYSEYEKLVQDVKNKEVELSEKSLSLHPEFEKRKKVLKALGYIDSEENVELKGSVAREMSNHELLITELLVKSVFNDCEPEDVAALLSCMVFQQKCRDEPELPDHLIKKVEEVIQVAHEISKEQQENEIEEPNFVEQYNFHLVNVVYEWAKGTSFAKIKETTDIDEGIIVHSIRRLVELLKDVKNGATLVGDPGMARKMESASQLIKRGIVYMNSLYVKSSKTGNVSV